MMMNITKTMKIMTNIAITGIKKKTKKITMDENTKK